MQLLPAWENDMKKVIASAILMSLLLSCVEPEKADNISKGSNKSSSVTLKTSQVSNFYGKLLELCIITATKSS